MTEPDYIAVRDLPRTTVRARQELFDRLEAHRRRIGARSLNDAIVDLLEKALKR